jgi:hypothetical protein
VFGQLSELPSMESSRALQLDLRYEDMVKEMMLVESAYRTTLNVIVKGFMEVFQTQFGSETALVGDIFGNISEILELTQGLQSLLEDKLDVAEENDDVQYPAVGECFASLAEDYAFDVYDEYASKLPAAYGARFRQKSTPDDAIGSHTCRLKRAGV